MKRLLRPSLILLGTAVALVGGGGVLAFAGWTSRSTSVTFTITAAKIPQVARPTLATAIVPIVRWKGVRIAPDTPVHRYVVTRHLGPLQRVVCDQPATATTACIDAGAPPGRPVTYTVHATHGENWVGADSEASAPVSSRLTVEPSSTSSPPTLSPAEPDTDVSTAPVNPRMATDGSGVDPTASIGPAPTATGTPTPTEQPSTQQSPTIEDATTGGTPGTTP